MTYVLGALAGLFLGALSGYLKNLFIWRKYVQDRKDSDPHGETGAVYGRLFLSNAVNIAVLLVCFLLRNIVPFSFAAFLIATAVSLSLMNIMLSSGLKNR